jgi:diaminopimelate decarboxylase
LRWWRTLPATTFSNDVIAEVTHALSGLAILGEPGWPAAGDATAVGVALRVTKDAQVPTAVVDIAATALLRPALAGSPAAVLVLANTIRHMVPGPVGRRLAGTWLEHGDLLLNKRRRRAADTPAQHD